MPPQDHNGPPAHEVSVNPFSIANNAPVTSGTAIDASASTYPPGAYPDMGDDHLLDTENGAVDVAAKPILASQQFAGWDQLVWGGDDSDTFYESDSGPAQGSVGFYPAGVGTFPVAQDGSAILLALYGNSAKPKFTKESLKPEIDVVAKSRIADFPKLKDAASEGDPFHRYTGDPEWMRVIQLIAQRSDQLQQQVNELQSFIGRRTGPRWAVRWSEPRATRPNRWESRKPRVGGSWKPPRFWRAPNRAAVGELRRVSAELRGSFVTRLALFP